MKRHSWFQVFLLPSLISLAFHGCAFIVIASSQYRTGLPARWINQSLFAVSAMLAASLFGRKKPYYPLLLILRFILLMVLSAPVSGNILIRMALILPFISDLLALAPRKWILYVIAATSVGIAILGQQKITAWGMPTPVPDSSTRLLVGLISGAWIVLTASASRSQKKSLLLGLEIARLNSVIDRLTDANVSFQNYARGVVDVTIQQERLRISKDIHDTVGYTFTNVRMLIEACIAIVGQRMPKVLELLHDAKNQSLEALAEVRRELGNMRNYHAEMLKLPNAMKKVGEMFEKATGVRVNIELTELPWEQSTQAEMAIYHLVQEGLTNAFRHGKATEVTVLFRNDKDSLLTIIRDNGEGASEITEGIGLKGMNERFQELGGDVTCGSVADGFELRATLPKKIQIRIPMKVIRVLLVDDQSLFVKSLEIVLQTLAKDLKVVGVSYNGREAVEFLEHNEVDVVLMDIRMPEMDGVQAVKLIHGSDPRVKIVMLTTFDDDRYIKEALENGAAGYVLKNIEPAELISYIRAVVNRSIVVSNQVLDRILSIGRDGAPRRDADLISEVSLSHRESEVARLLVNGYTNLEISEKLFIAEQTVRNHISTIYGKTGIHSRGELIKVIREQEIH